MPPYAMSKGHILMKLFLAVVLLLGLTMPVSQADALRCAPFPAFPDASCTGPQGQLVPWTGPMQFRTSGQVIENVEIRTSTGVYISGSANNMVFRNVRF